MHSFLCICPFCIKLAKTAILTLGLMKQRTEVEYG